MGVYLKFLMLVRCGPKSFCIIQYTQLQYWSPNSIRGKIQGITTLTLIRGALSALVVPPPPPALSSPVLSLSLSATCIHLHTALSLVRIPLPAFIPPPWNMAAVSGEIDTTADGIPPLLLVTVPSCVCVGDQHSHTQNFPMTIQTVTYMLPALSTTQTTLSCTRNWQMSQNPAREKLFDRTTVFFHVL